MCVCFDVYFKHTVRYNMMLGYVSRSLAWKAESPYSALMRRWEAKPSLSSRALLGLLHLGGCGKQLQWLKAWKIRSLQNDESGLFNLKKRRLKGENKWYLSVERVLRKKKVAVFFLLHSSIWRENCLRNAVCTKEGFFQQRGFLYWLRDGTRCPLRCLFTMSLWWLDWEFAHQKNCETICCIS